MRKKRIMVSSEASFLSTGYAVYGLELLKRLHATGKYELFEFSSYGPIGDPRAANIPWGYMSAMPDQNNPDEVAEYNSKPTNQFGEWRFEEACLKFHPDVVINYKDEWMMSHEAHSPFRNYYNWSIMPTCDATPQSTQWVATYLTADAVFTYSDWALDVLKEQSQGRIKTKCSAPAGANLQEFKLVQDRKSHRQSMGIPPEALIVGTIMRNQKRKLYPDLIESFAKFLKEAPSELSRRSFLYLHTSWPDVGWDIPWLIKEAGIGHKVLFTYICRKCNSAFPSFFQDAKNFCPKCGSPNAGFPNTGFAVSREVLGAIIGLFDCYVQYANSEGQGLPQVEAAACGIPVFAVDYSAMSDVVRKLGGIPVAVKAFSREAETNCLRAIPDNNDFVRKLIEFLQLPESVRRKMGFDARQAVAKHYSYDKTARIWMDHFDSIDAKPHELTWLSPAKLHKPNLNIPKGLTTEEFVRWGIANIAGRPDLVHSYMAMRMIRDLNWGASLPSMGGMYFNEASLLGQQQRFVPFNEEAAVKEMVKICEFRNKWERKRVGQ
jgi:glycosyltransferase involved in cell wall biosynthesis